MSIHSPSGGLYQLLALGRALAVLVHASAISAAEQATASNTKVADEPRKCLIRQHQKDQADGQQLAVADAIRQGPNR